MVFDISRGIMLPRYKISTPIYIFLRYDLETLMKNRIKPMMNVAAPIAPISPAMICRTTMEVNDFSASSKVSMCSLLAAFLKLMMVSIEPTINKTPPRTMSDWYDIFVLSWDRANQHFIKSQSKNHLHAPRQAQPIGEKLSSHHSRTRPTNVRMDLSHLDEIIV